MPATSPAKLGVSGRIDIGMLRPTPRKVVVPAKAGTHSSTARKADRWIPAFVGMTIYTEQGLSRTLKTASRCPAVAERVLAQEIEIAAAVGLQDLAAVE